MGVKILLVLDHRNLAFDNVVRVWEKTIKVDLLYLEDFDSPKDLLHKVMISDSAIVHFMWRKWLLDFTRSSDSFQLLIELTNSKFITTHIPDYLYLEPDQLENTRKMLSMVDAYFTVSQDLFDKYSFLFPEHQPSMVVNDLANVEEFNPTTTLATKDPLRLLWVGNSEWGKWYGKSDAKGLEAVVKPVFNYMTERYSAKCTIVDSSKHRLNKEQMKGVYANHDIILIASDSEGTALPAMEAASAGLAIVSTNTGTISEWCGKLQSELIVDRNVESFIKVISKLHKDRNLLLKIQNQNIANYVKFYSRKKSDIRIFFRKVASGKNTNTIKIDKHYVQLSTNQATKLNSKVFWFLFYRFKDTLWLKSILDIDFVHKIATKLLRKFNILNEQDHSFQQAFFLLQVARIKKKQTLAFYDPRWLGVAASTKSIFSNSFALPVDVKLSQQVVSREFLDELTRILIAKQPMEIVLSGGDVWQWEIVEALKDDSRLKSTRFSILWHSALPYLADNHDRGILQFWIEKYRLGSISAINVVDRNTKVLMDSINVESQVVLNRIPRETFLISKAEPNKEMLKGVYSVKNKVLIASAKPEFRKNTENMLVAMLAADSLSQINLIGDSGVFRLISNHDWIAASSELEDLSNRIKHRPRLNRNEFLVEMVSSDVVLYVSYSEASPMLPLEALSLGIPILVSNSTPYLNGFPELREMCTIQDPNDIEEIITKFREVIEKKQRFQVLSRAFVSKYEKKASITNNQIYGNVL
jgi:glycosyltransferase involved in cell wall biosynthesis